MVNFFQQKQRSPILILITVTSFNKNDSYHFQTYPYTNIKTVISAIWIINEDVNTNLYQILNF